ncbi:hypothetical protein A6R68_02724, partial [Neotoma lepida]
MNAPKCTEHPQYREPPLVSQGVPTSPIVCVQAPNQAKQCKLAPPSYCGGEMSDSPTVVPQDEEMRMAHEERL